MDDAEIPDGSAADKEEKGRMNPIVTAALLGGGVAAAAGAYFGTRALARKNKEQNGRPLNSVLATAITACDLAHDKEAAPAADASVKPEKV
ncbi:MAG TPA: hypothetical protein VGD10_09775 [Allosphingosinicella sp.]|uniref:hypothetical protein n=1 Tax=Allosphingosinicella sp. TaxID=2823234 RepID=UPI002ED926C3